MNTLIDLLTYGQSYWLDNLTRKKIIDGELRKRVEEQGLRGVTSNPSIFNKAISDSNDYDEQITRLVKSGESIQNIYEAITIKDVQDACDILKPVYEQSGGADGFVSLEVSPFLARDTDGTIEEARRLFQKVARENCMIKIPGTSEGIPAIEQMLYEGVNINITLLFSLERYTQVAEAYIRAMGRRVYEGTPVKNVNSVASIFISRVDVLMDQILSQYIIPLEENTTPNRPELLLGKAGIATASVSYERFKEIFCGEAWEKLKLQGANVQRPLWASTSNKDPLYHDLRYVEPLIGNDTVNTLPDQTIAALADHGTLIKDAIVQTSDESRHFFVELKKTGIAIDFVTQQLENEGIQKFAEAYDELIGNLSKRRLEILGNDASLQKISCAKLDKIYHEACASIDSKQVRRRLFVKDSHLWKNDLEQIKEINHRLKWLDLPNQFEEHTERINLFAFKVKEEGYTHAVLLGMGGSSLCSEVAVETFDTSKGYLKLLVLDNTDPAAIHDVEKNICLETTLFIVASKSGNTEETLSFFHYFYQQLKSKNKIAPEKNFIAITDEGTPLVKIAEQFQFKKLFINPSDLGGRYSVLSDFGLVPMALMGIDINAVMSSARQMKNSCMQVPSINNPGISLGVLLGICQRYGRDKVTFVLSVSISSFGLWLEQLLAESTGKEGLGLIPVNGEELGTPEVYGTDRVFIHLYLSSDQHEADEQKLKALEEAGHPVVSIRVPNKWALGAEYYRWEVATAVAGMLIGINPFDQPNVEESKENTRRLLEDWSKEGSFKKVKPLLENDGISIYSGETINDLAIDAHESLGDFIEYFTSMAVSNDYIALLPYFMMTEHRTTILQRWRLHLRTELKVATTLLNGPRYLHSTGQLHKGGPASGLYILLVADEKEELTIPGEKFGFATLHQAQSLGDFRSLDDKGRRVIRIHLGKDIDAGLDKLYQSIQYASSEHVRQITI